MPNLPSARRFLPIPLLGLLLAPLAGAQEAAAEVVEATPDAGNTSWMIVASVLVLLMTLPGLAMFYGGLVRAKNALSIFVQCFAIAGVMSLLWVAFGYSVATTGEGPFIGGFDKLFLKGVTASSLVGDIPESVFVMFQMTFAIITPALIIGAFAERMKFSAVLIFTTVWFVLSYLPVWHMAWQANGLFFKWGVLDFAGGTVVHINAAIAGLVGCIVVGKRKGFGQSAMHPHQVPFAVIGAGLLWVGWFGFNAGSALAANASAGMAMLSTQVATAAAVIVWMAIEWIVSGKPTAVGVATGAVAGLVAITPACGSCGTMGAIAIGAAASLLCYLCATKLKAKLGYDDSLDVFGVHGIGGITGALLAGVFAAPSLGGQGIPNDGTIGSQVLIQLSSVGITIVWSLVASVIALVIARVLLGGLRVEEKVEVEGLDYAEHGETAYTL
jgi:Amt family ammonium transporter